MAIDCTVSVFAVLVAQSYLSIILYVDSLLWSLRLSLDISSVYDFTNCAEIYGDYSVVHPLACALDYYEACSTLLHNGTAWSLYC